MHHPRVRIGQYPLIELELELSEITTREVSRARPLRCGSARCTKSPCLLMHLLRPTSHLFRLTRQLQSVCNSSTRADSHEAKANRTVSIWVLSEALIHVMPARYGSLNGPITRPAVKYSTIYVNSTRCLLF